MKLVCDGLRKRRKGVSRPRERRCSDDSRPVCFQEGRRLLASRSSVVDRGGGKVGISDEEGRLKAEGRDLDATFSVLVPPQQNSKLVID